MSTFITSLRTLIFAAITLIGCMGAHAASNATADDVAKFLAGMEPSAGSPLSPLTKGQTWQQHSRQMERAWGEIDKRQLSKVRKWSEANLKAPRPVLFYMFSGPDFLYANAFFPKASTYVFAGLEPVGGLPDGSDFASRAMSGSLAHVKSSINTVMNYSFFMTKEMNVKLKSGPLRGTLPILYVFLARSGKTITDVQLVKIGADGQIEPDVAGAPKSTAPGVKIVFKSEGGAPQTLYYFSTNIANDGLKNSGLTKFCSSLGKGDAFVKSASYLMHSGSFSGIRDYLLENATTILQDDSGIPVRFFDEAQWQLKPHGRYLGPISLFAGQYQQKLNSVFRKGPSNPIGFGIGYRWRPNESNLLLAVRAERTAEKKD